MHCTSIASRTLQPCGTVAAYDRHRGRGEEPCQPCRAAKATYNRAFRDRKRRGEVSPPPPLPSPKPCGTVAAYKRHLKRGEVICLPCKIAVREYSRNRYAEGRTILQTPLDESNCGTTAGYQAHIKRKLPPCEPCKAAKRAYNNARNRMRGMPERKVDPQLCGTIGGYRRHVREKEPACDACKAAARDDSTARRRQNGIGPPKTAQCGTRSGYLKHYRNGEEACRPCKQSYADCMGLRKHWKQLWDEQDGACPLWFRAVPFESGKVHVDHIIPRSKNGSDDISNLQAVHARCNMIKKNSSDGYARKRIAEMIASGEY